MPFSQLDGPHLFSPMSTQRFQVSVAAMRDFPLDAAVQLRELGALAALSESKDGNDPNKRAAVSAGALHATVQAMHAHADVAAVQTAACVLLRNLARHAGNQPRGTKFFSPHFCLSFFPLCPVMPLTLAIAHHSRRGGCRRGRRTFFVFARRPP